MEYTCRAQIAAPAETAWSVLADLRRWPTWTSTVESVDCPSPQPEVGQEVAVKQPGRRVARYTVTTVEDGRRFVWGSQRGGVHQFADHVVTPNGSNACTVELSFAMGGLFGGFLGRLGASKIRHMVDTESAALKAHVEGSAAPRDQSLRNTGRSA
jgi:uncharacterized membrane protein